MASARTLSAQIEQRLGGFPAFLNPARHSDHLLEYLWTQWRLGCLDNPLPLLLKEKVLAYLARCAGSAYWTAWHMCELHRLGLDAGEVLNLLQPATSNGNGHAAAGRSLQQDVKLLRLAADAYLHPAELPSLRAELDEATAEHVAVLISAARALHQWTAGHPEIVYRAAELDRLLNTEPALAVFIHETGRTNGNTLDVQQLQAGAVLMRAPFPVMIYAEDGQVLQANDVWTELTGYSLREIPTFADWCRRAQPEAQTPDASEIDALYQSEHRVEEGEQTIQTAMGTQLVWDLTSVPLGRLPDGRRAVLRMAEDATERRHLEKALWASNRRLTNIIESITDGFFTLSRDWRFTYINEKAEELLGRSRRKLMGKTIWSELPEAEEAGLRSSAQEAAARGAAAHAEAHFRQSGRWFDFHLYPSDDGMCVYFRDVTERIRLAEELRAAKQRLEAMIKAAPLAIVSVDASDNVVLWSPAAEKVFGWTEREVLNQPYPAYQPIDQDPHLKTRLEAIRTHTPFFYEARRRTKDGRVIDVGVWGAPLYDRNGLREGGLALIADFTERKKAEEALRRSEARVRALLSAVPDLLFHVTRDGTFLDYISVSGKPTYVPPAEFLGRKVAEVLPADVGPRIAQAIGAALDTGQMQTIEYPLTILGQRCWSEARIAACGADEALIIVRDITVRKATEAALQDAHQTLAALVSASPHAVIVLDLNRNVTLWNPAARDLFGWSEQEVLYRSLPIAPPQAASQYVQMYEQVIAGQPVVNVTSPALCKDGRTIPVNLSIMPVRNAAGQVCCCMLSISAADAPWFQPPHHPHH